jgi:DNA-binding NarL/FixJ family response regulator
MVRVYLANAQPDERSAFCLLLLDLNMEIVGEASDWQTTLEEAPATHFDLLLLDADLLPPEAMLGMAKLRRACSHEFVTLLVSPMDARQHAAYFAGADDFISKSEVPKRLAERLQAAAREIVHP